MRKITNKEAAKLIRERKEFVTYSIEGKNINELYVVYSYKVPILIFDRNEGKWAYNRGSDLADVQKRHIKMVDWYDVWGWADFDDYFRKLYEYETAPTLPKPDKLKLDNLYG